MTPGAVFALPSHSSSSRARESDIEADRATDKALLETLGVIAADFEKAVDKYKKLDGKAKHLQAILEAVQVALQCGICERLHGDGVTFHECGHTAGGTCVRDAFRRILEQRLPAVVGFPISRDELRQIANQILLFGGDPNIFFSYPCPLCLTTIRRVPATATGLNNVLMDLRPTLATLHDGDGGSSGDDGDVNVIGSNFFCGLFLELEA
ncbi:hypothetical protein Hypma_003354 [Hypsizygus marmoreus]|uniref:Uncharacterized protein n=1 Tax=Hypsizygus marmoreus TaxID=39966 RepID=A0A369J6C2_HYPMA|nr:hypothetical protein Hypma_003354 [Hypsizygus marmoreus]